MTQPPASAPCSRRTYVASSKAKRLAEAGVSLDAAKDELDYRWSWQARGAYEQAERFSVDELAAAVVRFAALDGALKGVSRLSPDLELERALVETTAAPSRD